MFPRSASVFPCSLEAAGFVVVLTISGLVDPSPSMSDCLPGTSERCCVAAVTAPDRKMQVKSERCCCVAAVTAPPQKSLLQKRFFSPVQRATQLL